jgi:Ca-activated chloride channel homolog
MRFPFLISALLLVFPIMGLRQTQSPTPPAPQSPTQPQAQQQAQPPSPTPATGQPRPESSGQSQVQYPVELPSNQTQDASQQPAPPTGSSQAPPQGTGHMIITHTEEVIVPVTVKDSRGVLVTDLRRDEFRIFEDGIDQQIIRFQEDPHPLSAVILVDNDLADKTVDPVQRSLETISAGFGPRDEVALVTFDRFQKTVMNFSRSNDIVFTQLKRLKLGSSFPTGFGGPLDSQPQLNNRPVAGGAPKVTVESPETKNIDDAVHYAGEMLRVRGPERRKLIFLISDGHNSHNNQWSYSTTVELLLSANVSVYGVIVGLNPLHLEGQRMVHYATATGGDVYTASRQQELERLYGQITEQARNQYTLGYSPQHRTGSRVYHTIEVRVRRPDLKLLARQGYYTAAVR